MGIGSTSFDVGKVFAGQGRSPEAGPSIIEPQCDSSARWKHRRWMAWITFIFDHLLILFIVFYAPPINGYESIINTFFMISAAVLSAYIGFSTWDDISKKKEEISFERQKLFETPHNTQDQDER